MGARDDLAGKVFDIMGPPGLFPFGLQIEVIQDEGPYVWGTFIVTVPAEVEVLGFQLFVLPDGYIHQRAFAMTYKKDGKVRTISWHAPGPNWGTVNVGEGRVIPAHLEDIEAVQRSF